MKSRCYIGHLRHRRYHPARNNFTYPTAMVYMDLDELQQLCQQHPWWGFRRPGLARFHRGDYLNPDTPSLKEAVYATVEAECGKRPAGPVRMLTHLRYGGHCFNPVTFYYCFDRSDSRVESVVAEITNTPWRERHCYVLQRPHADKPLYWQFSKQFHVSPFNPMQQDYQWHFSEPQQSLGVHMVNLNAQGKTVFDATLSLRAKPMSQRQQSLLLLRFPWHTLVILARIHWQALKLWWKRVPFHVHPKKRAQTQQASAQRSHA